MKFLISFLLFLFNSINSDKLNLLFKFQKRIILSLPPVINEYGCFFKQLIPYTSL